MAQPYPASVKVSEDTMRTIESPSAPLGPLSQKLLEFLETMERLVAQAQPPTSADYWAPMTEFIAVEEFRRLVPEHAFSAPADSSDDGNAPWEHTTMGWAAYLEAFNTWAESSPQFENVIWRIAEFPDLVYLEIKEHHGRGDEQHVFHSLSTYEFNSDGKITGIRVAPAARHLVTTASA
jgi:hypothetical protein